MNRMDRTSKLAILNSMNDESLNQALSAVGINCETDEYGEDMGDNQIESWGTMDVSVPMGRRGSIVDKTMLFRDQPESHGAMPRDLLGISLPSEEDELLAAGLM